MTMTTKGRSIFIDRIQEKVNQKLLQLQLQLQQGLVVRLLQTERWRITMSLSRGIVSDFQTNLACSVSDKRLIV